MERTRPTVADRAEIHGSRFSPTKRSNQPMQRLHLEGEVCHCGHRTRSLCVSIFQLSPEPASPWAHESQISSQSNVACCDFCLGSLWLMCEVSHQCIIGSRSRDWQSNKSGTPWLSALHCYYL